MTEDHVSMEMFEAGITHGVNIYDEYIAKVKEPTWEQKLGCALQAIQRVGMDNNITISLHPDNVVADFLQEENERLAGHIIDISRIRHSGDPSAETRILILISYARMEWGMRAATAALFSGMSK